MQDILLEAFSNIKVGVHIYRLEDSADDHSLRMVYANKYSEELIGQKVEDMVGKTIDESFPSIRDNGVPARYAEVVNSGVSATYEDISYADNHIAGAFSIYAYKVSTDCVAVMFDNITERVVAVSNLMKEKKATDGLNATMVNRELKMIELKKEIIDLQARLK